MFKPEFILENKTHKMFWDFEITTNHLIPSKTPDKVIIK